MIKISDNIYVEISAHSCNVGVIITREGLVMIDSPMAPADCLNLRNEISQIGSVRYLINTGAHLDHCSGNYYFEGIVVSHEQNREIILNSSIDELEIMLQKMTPNRIPLDKDFHFRAPNITFSQNLTLYLGGHSFKLINLPGHTPYEVAIYIPEEKVIFTGDNVVNGMTPFLHEAAPYAWLDSLSVLEQLDVDKIVPGHGTICNKSILPQMKNNINIWLEAVQQAIDQGMTMDEAQKNLKVLEHFPGDPKAMAFVQNMNVANLYKVLEGNAKTSKI